MGAPKQKWTEEEEAALKAGIAKYGIGKWSAIIKDQEFRMALHLRSNVDLKDKWRNMHILASGIGPRQKFRPVTNNTLASSMVSDDTTADDTTADDTTAPGTVVSSDETVCDAKPLVISENVPNGGSKRPMSRLNDHILDAIVKLKEPHGSNMSTIAAQLEEQYLAPPNFKRLLAANLKLLTDDGKLIKVKHQYRIAPSSASLNVKQNNFPLLPDNRKDCRRAKSMDIIDPTSPILDVTCPPKAEMNDKIVAPLPLNGEKAEYHTAKKNGQQFLRRADIDAELRKMLLMTPEEAADAAAQAVKEAEVAIAEAEQAEREAEEAEREADAARAFAAVAVSEALKHKRFRH